MNFCFIFSESCTNFLFFVDDKLIGYNSIESALKSNEILEISLIGSWKLPNYRNAPFMEKKHFGESVPFSILAMEKHAPLNNSDAH